MKHSKTYNRSVLKNLKIEEKKAIAKQKKNFYGKLSLLCISSLLFTDFIAASSITPAGTFNRSAKGMVTVASSQNTGQVLLGNQVSGLIRISDSAGNTLINAGSSGSGNGEFLNLMDVFYDNSDNIFVADTGNNRVQKLDSSGNFIFTFGSTGAGDGQFSTPTGVAVNPSNNQIIVVDQNNSRVQIFDSSGNFISAFGSAGTGNGQFTTPTNVSIVNNQIAVVDSGNDRVQIFDNTGNFISSFGGTGTGNGQFINPRYIASDQASGQWLVVDNGNSRVQIFDSAGTYQSQFGSAGSGLGQFTDPRGIAVNISSGQIFVMNLGLSRLDVFFSPTLWMLPGTSILPQLALDHHLTLNNGFNLTIQNDLALGTGSTLTLKSGNLTTSTMTMDGGTLIDQANSTLSAPITVTGNNGTFGSKASNVLTIAADMGGIGGLDFNGAGLVVLTGNNTYSGGTTISNGRLSVNNTLAGAVTVNNGGILGGVGTINGTIQNAGTTSPGNSIGTLSVNGSYTQSGILNIELDATGLSSQLQVNGTPGTATISSGSLLNIQPYAGTYSSGTTYTILIATGGVVGTFSRVSVSNSNFGPLITPSIVYNPNSIQIVLTKKQIIPPHNNNPVTVPVANSLNNLPLPPSNSELVPMLVSLIAMNNTDALTLALSKISASETLVTTLVIQDNMAFLNSLNTSRTFALRKSNRYFLSGYNGGDNVIHHENRSNCESGIWVRSFGKRDEQETADPTTFKDRGFDAKTGGIMIGLDQAVSDNTFIGVSGGYTSSHVKWNDIGGKANIKSPVASFYGTWFDTQGYYVDATLSGGLLSYYVNRHLKFSAIDRHAINSHRGYVIAPHLGTGYTIQSCRLDLEFEPFVGVDYIYVHERKYKDTGAGCLNLDANKRSASLLRSETGFFMSKTFNGECITNCLEALTFSARVRLSYVNKKPLKKGALVAGLCGQPSTFRIESYTKVKNQISPGLGFVMQYNRCGFLNLWYDAELGSNSQMHALGLKLGVTF